MTGSNLRADIVLSTRRMFNALRARERHTRFGFYVLIVSSQVGDASGQPPNHCKKELRDCGTKRVIVG